MKRICTILSVSISVVVGGLISRAWSQEFPPVVNTDFAIALDQVTALGSLRTVGMGGVAAAVAESSGESPFNPAAGAALAIKQPNGWNFDWHFDYVAGSSKDADNNGAADPSPSSFGGNTGTSGLVINRNLWALGLNYFWHSRQLGKLESRVNVVSLQLSRSFMNGWFAVGIGWRAGVFSVVDDDNRELFSITGRAPEFGFLVRPHNMNFRIGGAATFSIAGSEITVDDCNPMDCMGYILPQRVRVPWLTSVGYAVRWAQTPWNRAPSHFATRKNRYEDERYLMIGSDLVLTGGHHDTYNLETFSERRLQPQARSNSVSWRLGAESEWLPGYVRTRIGTYWEPSRNFGPNGQQIGGRWHGTFGVDVRVWSFCTWSFCRRVRLSFSLDGAKRYSNGGLSLGFWH